MLVTRIVAVRVRKTNGVVQSIGKQIPTLGIFSLAEKRIVRAREPSLRRPKIASVKEIELRGGAINESVAFFAGEAGR
jgi:hypothetical protein